MDAVTGEVIEAVVELWEIGIEQDERLKPSAVSGDMQDS